MRTSPLSHAGNIDVTATVTDTQSIVTFTVTDTEEAIEAADVTDTVTDTAPFPGADYKKERAPDGVTDTVTDTSTSPPAKRKAPSRKGAVTDTVTVTDPALEPYDTSKYRLGTLCPRNHDYHGTGQSLRKNNKAGGCLACDAVLAKERREAKRKAPRTTT